MDRFFYHFSEDPNISQFEPRPVQKPVVRAAGMGWLNSNLVWAIDAKHSPLYLFPRECPRILMMKLENSTKEDIDKYWTNSSRSFVAFIEDNWGEKIENTTTYRYSFEKEGFQNLNDIGMHVSENTVVPVDVHEIGDIFSALENANVEVHKRSDLCTLKNAWDSTLHVSGIRLRNAINWNRSPL